MKFYNLFRKELKEMLNMQTITVMVISVIALVFAGRAMSEAVDESTSNMLDITVCDMDKTDFTDAVLTELTNQLKAAGGEVRTVEIQSEDYAAEMKRLNIKSCVVIPKGFTETVEADQQATVEFVQKMTSLATMSNLTTGSDAALAMLEAAVKSTIYADKINDGSMTMEEVIQLEAPLALEEHTVVADKSENISSSIVMSLCSAQTMIVPIIMFVLIIFSSQMILGAISTEKIDKTLETLLSAPVSRLSVISSKMLAAGIVAALQAAVYMIGMQEMMSGLTGGSEATSAYDNALKNLGLTMNAGQYIMVGVQMFLSILIALSISMILGALAKDAKSAQTLLLPITFSTMIPYLLSMVLDVRTVTPVLRYIVYAIPFTHTFMASENAMFSNMGIYWGGLIYQAAFLVICMTLALRIFMSDKIFTMSIGGKKKEKKR